jgi:hypothetical protein
MFSSVLSDKKESPDSKRIDKKNESIKKYTSDFNLKQRPTSAFMTK